MIPMKDRRDEARRLLAQGIAPCQERNRKFTIGHIGHELSCVGRCAGHADSLNPGHGSTNFAPGDD